MEFKIIRKINKWLNAFSSGVLIFGVVSILITAQNASEVWSIITLSLLFSGWMSLSISWMIKRWKTVFITKDEISYLNINTTNIRDQLNEPEAIEYLGNWLVLHDNRRIEIDRIHVIPLIKELNETRVRLKAIEQKFYYLSPKELLKFLGSLGP
ncbi:MAG: hypothetical protein AB8F74_08900 [Saprospiraceae bacterium]